ncbi:MAG: hypothetical protein JSS10_07950 [Verrucomicrobia bacterium]|nr:hypothetical protein [Verrucomicrobiota bacterium]
MASVNLPLQIHACFTELQEKFDNLIPCFTWSFPDENETWPESVRLSMESCIPKIAYLFELAIKDFECLYNEVYNEVYNEAKSLTAFPENYPPIMAELLTDQKKRYYEMFCDPGKPSLFFFYRFVRGYIYFVFLDRGHPYKRRSFAFNLQTKDVQPFFTADTVKSAWRHSYNSQIDKWASVISHLPPEIAQWAVKDEQDFPLPDNSSQRGFKIHQPKLLIGVQI